MAGDDGCLDLVGAVWRQDRKPAVSADLLGSGLGTRATVRISPSKGNAHVSTDLVSP